MRLSNFIAALRSIVAIHENRFTRIESLRPIRHEYWVLDYLQGGRGLVRTSVSGDEWRMREHGEAHLYPPGTEYWEREIDTSTKSCHLIFECEDDYCFRQLVADSPYGYALIADNASILLKLFRKYDSAVSMNESQRIALGNSIFWEIIFHLLSLPPSENGRYILTSDSTTDRQSPLVRGVLEWLDEHHAEKVSIADIRREFAVSRTALYNEFVKKTGETPSGALNRIRLKHADNLLLRGKRLKEIAEFTGFSSAYHLSKAYKKFYGIPPSKARKTNYFSQKSRLQKKSSSTGC